MTGAPQAPLEIRGAEILAPMVRASTLPLRLESLRYGADYVFGEEVIDRKIIGAVRVENRAFGTIDYVSPRERCAIFTTAPEERQRVIFQVGTADPVLAVEAARTVCEDVRGIDVNMGCPKSFSVKGGMGAALLEKPEAAAEILKSLRRGLPASTSVTCKIRMLATAEATRDFMRCCEASGAEAITVHMRTRDERPAHPAHWSEILRLWDAVRVPVVANGDFFTRRQIDEFWKHCRGGSEGEASEDSVGHRCGPAAIMIARGALWNPAIFCRPTRCGADFASPSFEEVVRRYTATAVSVNATYQNTKWVLNQMVAGGAGITPPTTFVGTPIKRFNKLIGEAKSMASISSTVDMSYSAAEWPPDSHTIAFYRGVAGAASVREAALAAGIDLDAPPAAGAKRAAGAAPTEPPLPEPGGGDVGLDESAAQKKARVAE